MPRVELQNGTEVLFLAPGAQGDFEAQAVDVKKVTAKLEDVARRGGEVLVEAASGVRKVLDAVKPSELELEIGVSVGAEGSIIIASGKAEGTIKIKAVWK